LWWLVRQVAAKQHNASVSRQSIGPHEELTEIPVPQFILDDLIKSNKGSPASILITQPRRLSAISVAARVSAERLDDGSVGYAIRGESKQTAKTKLLFCTTGVILRRLGSGDSLKGVTHIVVDEVRFRPPISFKHSLLFIGPRTLR
jgi:hypothetical protein